MLLTQGGPNPNPTTVTFNAVGIKLSSGRNPSSTPNFLPAIPVKKKTYRRVALFGDLPIIRPIDLHKFLKNLYHLMTSMP